MSDRVIITGVEPMSDRLCVIPQGQAEADLQFIAALTGSTTFGEVRKHPMAWVEVTEHEHYDDDDELVDATPAQSRLGRPSIWSLRTTAQTVQCRFVDLGEHPYLGVPLEPVSLGRPAHGRLGGVEVPRPDPGPTD